jgi:hypothetical protein
MEQPPSITKASLTLAQQRLQDASVDPNVVVCFRLIGQEWWEEIEVDNVYNLWQRTHLNQKMTGSTDKAGPMEKWLVEVQKWALRSVTEHSAAAIDNTEVPGTTEKIDGDA